MVIDGAQERLFCSFLVTEQKQRLALAVQTARLVAGQGDAAPMMATSQLRVTAWRAVGPIRRCGRIRTP